MRDERFHKNMDEIKQTGVALFGFFCGYLTLCRVQLLLARTLPSFYLLSRPILSVFLRGTCAFVKAYRKTQHIKNSLQLEFCVGEGRNAV